MLRRLLSLLILSLLVVAPQPAPAALKLDRKDAAVPQAQPEQPPPQPRPPRKRPEPESRSEEPPSLGQPAIAAPAAPPAAGVPESGEPGWASDPRSRCRVWAPEAKADATVSWSGRCGRGLAS